MINLFIFIISSFGKERSAMKITYALPPIVHRASLILTLGLFALLALFGTQLPSAAAQSPAFVRVIHASPFVGTADVFVDGTLLLSSFAFGAVTDYAPLPPGPHKVQIALVGKGIGAAALSQTLAVSPGLAYTVAAIGATPASLSLEAFVDDNTLITPGTAKVRVYNLSPDAGSFSVAAGGKTLVSGVAYQQASSYVTAATGAYTFNAHAAQDNTTLSITAALKPNMVMSVFTVGMVNGTPKLALVSAQASGLPGLPGTGSDPSASARNTQSLTPLLVLLGAWVSVIIGMSVLTRRLAKVR
jgi:hypothetical protein